MELYDSNGYVSIAGILDRECPFNFVTGGRGTGKTYGALKYVLENNIKFIYTRRTQVQTDLISSPEMTPFKSVCNDLGIVVTAIPIPRAKGCYAFYIVDETGDEPVVSGEPIGLAASLSTFSNLRGFDASDIELWIHDEFIPERHERAIKNESDAFLNCYETINRNRELQGGKPLQVIALSNSNTFANPLYLAFNLVEVVDKMRKKGRTYRIDKNRGIALYLLDDSPISQMKSETALYKAMKGSKFSEMALSNNFNDFSEQGIVHRQLRDYKPLVNIGDITVYEPKSGGLLYVSEHLSGIPRYTYEDSDNGARAFRSEHLYLRMLHVDGRLLYESAKVKVKFENLIMVR